MDRGMIIVYPVLLCVVLGTCRGNVLFLEDNCGASCHKQIVVNGSGIIYSQRGLSYMENINHTLTITASAGHIIRLIINELMLYNNLPCRDHVQFFDGNNETSLEALTTNLCSNPYLSKNEVYSRTNIMTMVFKTFSSSSTSRLGFKMTYNVTVKNDVPVFLQEECINSNPVRIDGTMKTSANARRIFSHRFGTHYNTSIDCGFILSLAAGEKIYMRVDYMKLSKGFGPCDVSGEYVRIYDGVYNTGVPLSEPMCIDGQSYPFTVDIAVSASNQVYGELITSSVSKTGNYFILSYSAALKTAHPMLTTTNSCAFTVANQRTLFAMVIVVVGVTDRYFKYI